MSSSISELDSEALRMVPPVVPSKSPKEYFQLGAGYLKQAGVYKKVGNNAQSYLFLKKYFVLINQRLPQHPQINQSQYAQEYQFNQRKCNQLKTEILRLKQTIDNSSAYDDFYSGDTSSYGTNSNYGGYGSNTYGESSSSNKYSGLGKANLPPTPPDASSKSSSKSWISSLWGGSGEKPKSSTKLPPPPVQARNKGNNLPPPPNQVSVYTNNDDLMTLEDPKNLPVHDRVAYKAMENVMMNENVQNRVGHGVARIAANEQFQERMADGISNAANNKNYQRSVGATLAANTDNAVIKQLAMNEQFQGAVGKTISSTVGNKEVQRKVGKAVSDAATNKEVQRKVASGLLTVGKLSWQAGKTGAKYGAKGVVGGTKLGISAYGAYQEEQKKQNSTGTPGTPTNYNNY